MNYYNTSAYQNPMARWYSRYASPMRKSAAQPPMGGGGMPPMDPSMMGGAPPMDPSMMGGAPPMDPSMMGGAPPMDPSMMGGMPAPPPPMDPSMMGGMPPMDPSMMGMPPAAPPPGDASMSGMPGEEPKKSKKQALDEQVSKISTGIYNMQVMLAAIIDQCGVKLPASALITPPNGDGPDITNPVPSLVDISTGTPNAEGPAPAIGGEMPKTGSLRSLLRYSAPNLTDLLR